MAARSSKDFACCIQSPSGVAEAGSRVGSPDRPVKTAHRLKTSVTAHRLHPFVPELLEQLTRVGELTLASPVDKRLRQASRRTLARLLAPARARYPRRGAPIPRPGTELRQRIPIRTFTEWDDARPGFSPYSGAALLR
jgi:hypothetical protein